MRMAKKNTDAKSKSFYFETQTLLKNENEGIFLIGLIGKRLDFHQLGLKKSL